MKTVYREKRFADATLAVIEAADAILHEYDAQGYTLTLRQLYYQFVARDLLPNTQRSYKRLGSIINDARLAGYIDWDHMEDRTRNLQRLPDWSDPAEIVESAAKQFRLDKWADQEFRPEVWIEKDALLGVIEGVCDKPKCPTSRVAATRRRAKSTRQPNACPSTRTPTRHPSSSTWATTTPAGST